MSNPVWNWLVRSPMSAYQAATYFKQAGGWPVQPRWCCDRMGQSSTKLADGREVLIGGEHEDHYDPDFYIYNDVIIKHNDDRIEILGYPEEVFVPTDFHSATLIDDESKILILGNLGYPADRQPGTTQVLSLELDSREIRPIVTTGECPGWIHDHQAVLDSSGSSILISGGKVHRRDSKLLENIDDWRLDLTRWRWERLTDRKWQRLEIRRVDSDWLHLWETGQIAWQAEMGMQNENDVEELKSKTGVEPDLTLYKNRYQPSMEYSPVDEDENEWNVIRIEINGVIVRFVEDMQSIVMTVEGALPLESVETVAQEICDKLARLENSACCFEWIEP